MYSIDSFSNRQFARFWSSQHHLTHSRWIASCSVRLSKTPAKKPSESLSVCQSQVIQNPPDADHVMANATAGAGGIAPAVAAEEDFQSAALQEALAEHDSFKITRRPKREKTATEVQQEVTHINPRHIRLSSTGELRYSRSTNKSVALEATREAVEPIGQAAMLQSAFESNGTSLAWQAAFGSNGTLATFRAALGLNGTLSKVEKEVAPAQLYNETIKIGVRAKPPEIEHIPERNILHIMSKGTLGDAGLAQEAAAAEVETEQAENAKEEARTTIPPVIARMPQIKPRQIRSRETGTVRTAGEVEKGANTEMEEDSETEHWAVGRMAVAKFRMMFPGISKGLSNDTDSLNWDALPSTTQTTTTLAAFSETVINDTDYRVWAWFSVQAIDSITGTIIAHGGEKPSSNMLLGPRKQSDPTTFPGELECFRHKVCIKFWNPYTICCKTVRAPKAGEHLDILISDVLGTHSVSMNETSKFRYKNIQVPDVDSEFWRRIKSYQQMEKDGQLVEEAEGRPTTTTEDPNWGILEPKKTSPLPLWSPLNPAKDDGIKWGHERRWASESGFIMPKLFSTDPRDRQGPIALTSCMFVLISMKRICGFRALQEPLLQK
eukprot:gnl/MRDRNA2_/MRDRNA2_122205_c0_seq1.p1 gnl/MRDRNA2_/MRDRNA2_122205_c0~~gnl/MRDRNA2_/MRDRNA2_122205_c0_seq1.p1  ORF type:complete len:607 (-),score=91.13 gnl/MRDRNA2_/MRDRNA2_122205_c0_seq1:155-1975(-)